MSYIGSLNNECPINEAFCDPINLRKRDRGEMVFQKDDPENYTTPHHFPNYLCEYQPMNPLPPTPPHESYNNYPRSKLLKCDTFACKPHTSKYYKN